MAASYSATPHATVHSFCMKLESLGAQDVRHSPARLFRLERGVLLFNAVTNEEKELPEATPMKDPESGAKEKEGRYSNYCEIGTNEIEFLLAFGQWYGAGTEPNIHTRIVTTPFHAKEISKLLEISLAGYESKYGPITSRDDGAPK